MVFVWPALERLALALKGAPDHVDGRAGAAVCDTPIQKMLHKQNAAVSGGSEALKSS